MLRSIKAGAPALVTVLLSAACTTMPPAVAATGEYTQSGTQQSVEDLLADYGFFADQRDTVAVALLFTPDGHLTVPSIGAQAQGRNAIAALYGQAWAQVAASNQQRRHAITSIRLSNMTAGSADFRAIMNVTGTPAGGQPATYLTGYYRGTATLTENGWKLSRLEINID